MIISGVGRLGRDAEVRYIPSGTAVANLAVSFNFGKKNEQGNRDSQWLDLSLWGKQAEALSQYLTKGAQVSITADAPHIEYYIKNDGERQGKLVANIISIELLGGGKQSDQSSLPKQTSHHEQKSNGYQKQPENYDDYDQNIPFN